MKKWFCLLSILIPCIFRTLPVRADVIWEPDDNFYNQHASECTYASRMYIANGPDGNVTVYKSPESPQVITQLENGSKTQISFTYEDSDGILWGVYESSDYTETGWMPMDYMEVVYDSISFAEEFDADITVQDGDIDDAYRNQTIYLFEYPGSADSYAMEPQDDLPSYDQVFTDENNLNWGHVTYYFGMKNVWICIDQPTADLVTLYPDGAPQRGSAQNDNESTSSKENNTKKIVPKPNTRLVLLAITLVSAVVLITAGLLIILKRKK